MTQLRGGVVTKDSRLDRVVQFDERSRKFPLTVDSASKDVFRSYTWAVGLWLDQGREGACVGFSRAHALAARPQPRPDVTDLLAQDLYHGARRNDEWSGEDYDGSSVLGGLVYAKSIGLVKEYRWAFTL